MKIALISILCLLGLSGPTLASTFFPEDGTGVTPAVLDLLAKAEPGKDYILLDDMAFRVDKLTKSGFTGTRWTDGNVFYEFDGALEQWQRDNWLAAAQHWACVAGLNFVERTDQSDFIHVFTGDGNWSFVGMQGGPQNLSIVSWNAIFTIAHEIAHALGQIHEHSRAGRDTWVTMRLDRVCQDCCSGGSCNHNFEERASENYGDYDFDSVMHYGQCGFSTCADCGADPDNCRTIEVNSPWDVAWQNAIGQRNHLSAADMAGMAARYGPTFNSPPLAVTRGYAAHPDQGCCLAVDVADIDGGSTDPDGAGDIASICITAVDGADVGCVQQYEVCGLGTYIFTLTITDQCGETSSEDAAVELLDQAPVAVSQPFAAEADEHCCIVVDLADIDGGSYDPDGASDIVTTQITAVDGMPVVPGETVEVCGVGSHEVRITITDICGLMDSCEAPVEVIDVTPPSILVEVDRDVLWPPNHKMVPITATVTVEDSCDPDPVIQLVSVTCNEPDNDGGDGDTTEDIVILPGGNFLLRSERSGGGDGRIYTITYMVTDDSNNTNQSSAEVRVPHDQEGWALASTGLDPAHGGFEPTRRQFMLIVPSQPPDITYDAEGNRIVLREAFDATRVDAARVYVGNTSGVARPLESSAMDATGDGREDLAVTYSVREVERIIGTPLAGDDDAISLDDGSEPVGLHYRGADGTDYLVEDIFTLERLESPPLGKDPHRGEGPGDKGRELPAVRTGLLAVYPNPFNPTTTVELGLARDERVLVRIFDARGHLVRVLADELMTSGRHQVSWDGRDRLGGRAMAGVYFVHFRAGAEESAAKIVMIK
ncbi:MAG: M12 family metallopeptidase [Candidatus Krumholzibacteriia bacterium]